MHLRVRETRLVRVRDSGFRDPTSLCLYNPEFRKVLLVESGILGFGIQKTAQGIRNLSNHWNPESKFH